MPKVLHGLNGGVSAVSIGCPHTNLQCGSAASYLGWSRALAVVCFRRARLLLLALPGPSALLQGRRAKIRNGIQYAERCAGLATALCARTALHIKAITHLSITTQIFYRWALKQFNAPAGPC